MSDKLNEVWKKMYTSKKINESERDDPKNQSNEYDEKKGKLDTKNQTNAGPKGDTPVVNPDVDFEDSEWEEIATALQAGKLPASTIAKLKKAIKK